MIEFFYKPIVQKNKIIKKRSIKYPEILKNEGAFQIKINGALYFDDPNFSVEEFLLYVDKWLLNEDKTQNMCYLSVDTDENPLISFETEKDQWHISSPWELFKSKDSFTREELEKAITNLKKAVDC